MRPLGGMTLENLINDYTEQIKDLILDNEIKDIDTLNDQILQMIGGDKNVIYTYKAKEISEYICQYDAFDTSDITGERFENWPQVAFQNIYYLIYENIDTESLLIA